MCTGWFAADFCSGELERTFTMTPRLRRCYLSDDVSTAGSRNVGTVLTIDDVRSLAMELPRTTEGLVRDQVKFRVGRIVYLSFSPDETVMGFAFPKEEREALVASEPDTFMMPSGSDLRYNWVLVRLAAIDAIEMRELVVDAWRMVVPKRVAAAYDELHP
jgi:hypothetical protein